MTSQETICITRSGFNFLHADRVDLAAAVYRQSYVPNGNGSSGGRHVDMITDQVMFIPRFPPAWDTL